MRFLIQSYLQFTHTFLSLSLKILLMNIRLITVCCRSSSESMKSSNLTHSKDGGQRYSVFGKNEKKSQSRERCHKKSFQEQGYKLPRERKRDEHFIASGFGWGIKLGDPALCSYPTNYICWDDFDVWTYRLGIQRGS